jgi:hypothetical protein
VGTMVFVSDDKALLTRKDPTRDKEIFAFYTPNHKYPYWVFNGSYSDTASGFKYCKLAEPCKP